MLRLVHDVCLERGIAFQRERIIRVAGKGLELAIFHDKKGVLAKIGKASRIILFDNIGDTEEFEKGLDANDALDTRIKLALANGKLILVSATRAELEAVLP